MPLHRSSGRWRVGLCLSLIAVLLWGLLAVALKVTLQALDAYTVTWFRFLVSFILLAIYLAVTHRLPSWQQLKSISLGLIGTATVCLALNYILFLEGLRQTTPSSAQVITQLSPVMMGLGSLVIFKESYTRWQWLGLAVMTLGMVLFFNEQLQMLIVGAGSYIFGSALLVIASVIWAIYALAQKQLLQKLPSSAIMLCIYGGSALLFSPTATPAKLVAIAPLPFAALLFCALNTLAAYGCFAEALQHWEASRVSAVLTLTPLVTLGAVWLVGVAFPKLMAVETITPLSLTGALFVVLGSLAIALGGKPSSSPK